MQATRLLARNKLFLAFDAFGTLYHPSVPIQVAYGKAALRHNVNWLQNTSNQSHKHTVDTLPSAAFDEIKNSFSKSFKKESSRSPNYGRATGLGATQWWTNVIKGTFSPYIGPSEKVSEALISELLVRFSTSEGYDMYPDVLPFFRMLKQASTERARAENEATWRWEKTVVGIITNSDDRVASVLSSFGLKVGPRRVGGPSHRIAGVSPYNDIQFVVLSYDVGYEKPDHRIFDAAIEMLKETLASDPATFGESVNEYEKLYVGDSLEKDYLGAEASGWNAVYMDRSDVRTPQLDLLYDLLLKDFDSGEERLIQVCTNLDALTRWEPMNS